MSVSFFPALEPKERPAPVVVPRKEAASLAGWLGFDEQVEMDMAPSAVLEAIASAEALGCRASEIAAMKALAEAARAIGHGLHWHDHYGENSVDMCLIVSSEPADCPMTSWTATNAMSVLEAMGLPQDVKSYPCGSMDPGDFLERCEKALQDGADVARISTLKHIARYAAERGVPVCWG